MMNLITQKSIAKAIEYSEQPEKLKELLAGLTIMAERGLKKAVFGRKEKVYECRIIIHAYRADIEFMFYVSINDTKTIDERLALGDRWDSKILAKFKEFNDDLLYSVLCCCKSDYFCPDTFEDFCADYDYNSDSIKALETFKACQAQSAKLKTIFTPEEIECLPN